MAADHPVADATELQSALNTAAANDTITLTSSFTFSGSISYTNTNTPLTLRGENGQTFVLSGNDDNAPGGQWLTIAPNRILNLENLTFQDSDTTPLTFSSTLYGGGIVSAYDSGSATAEIGSLTGNTFVTVSMKAPRLYGGSVIGAYSAEGTARIGDLTQNRFEDIDVTLNNNPYSSDYVLYGSAVVGASNSYDNINSSKTSIIGNLTQNTFTGITVNLDRANLWGGGVIGVHNSNNDSTPNTSIIGNLTQNTFSHIVLSTPRRIAGGGIVGAMSLGAGAVAEIGDLHKNTFEEITVGGPGAKIDWLYGGGVVGVGNNSYAAAAFTLGNLTENTFKNIVVHVGTEISGSGVVGVGKLGGGGSMQMGNLTDNLFTGIDVTAGNFYGGGVVGVFSGSSPTMGDLTHNTFRDITITIASISANTSGGGVVGAGGSNAVLGKLTDNLFTGIDVSYHIYLTGGGIVGIGGYGGSGTSAPSIIDDLTRNTFKNITVDVGGVNGYLYGGGVVGMGVSQSQSNITPQKMNNLTENLFTRIEVLLPYGVQFRGGGVVGIGSMAGPAEMGSLTQNTFTDIEVSSFEGYDDFRGGGVVGVSSNSNTAKIGDLTKNTFTNIRVTIDQAGQSIQGGLVGARSNSATAMAAIGLVSENTLTGNTITSENGNIYGGLLYANTLGGLLNGEFTGNTFKAAATGRVFGAVTLDTARGPADAASLTVTAENRAENNRQVVFSNRSSDSLGMNRQAESLYLGRVDDANSTRDAILTLDARPGALIDLRDPIRVEQNNGFNFTLNIIGSGELRWGGANLLDIALGGSGAVTLQTGSRTYLLPGFSLSAPGGVANADVRLDSGSVLRLPVQEVYDPSTVPSIAANTVAGSGLIALDDRPLSGGIGITEGNVVLKMEDSPSVARTLALASGFLTRAADVYKYPYELDWGDGLSTSANNVILKVRGAPIYDPQQGGSDTTTGPGAIDSDPPAAELVRTHLRDFFWLREKRTPGRQLWVDTSFSRTHLRNGSRLGLSWRLDTPALLTGADLYATESALAGVALGISWPEYRGEHTRIDATDRLLMFYGAVSLPGGLELSGDVAASRSRYQHKRKIAVEENGETRTESYSARYRGHNLLAGLELAYPMDMKNGWELRPFLSQDYIRQTVSRYIEKEAGLNALTAQAQRHTLGITRLGTGIAWREDEQHKGWRFTGSGEAYWQMRSGDLAADTTVRFHNAPCADPSRDESCPSRVAHPSKSERLPSSALGLGMKARWDYRDRMNIRLGYDLRIAKRETTHAGSVRVEWKW